MEICVVAHCLLNPYTRVKGLGPLVFKPECATVQLPCPEALYLGLDRWAVTKNQLELPAFRRFCRSLIQHYADLIEMLSCRGVTIRLVGVARSPSCGIWTTSAGYTGGRVCQADHKHIRERGVFMEELIRELERRRVSFECDEAEEKGLNGIVSPSEGSRDIIK